VRICPFTCKQISKKSAQRLGEGMRQFMKNQVHVFYSGKVQGVGFRFAAQRIAYETGVFGRVKNLSDGRVEVLAEADVDSLKQFLQRMHEYFQRYIQDEDIDWQPATGEFKEFSIKF
jgi:acylphosphatase